MLSLCWTASYITCLYSGIEYNIFFPICQEEISICSVKLNLPTLDKAKIPHLGYLIDPISPQRYVGLRWGDLGLTQLGNFGFDGTFDKICLSYKLFRTRMLRLKLQPDETMEHMRCRPSIRAATWESMYSASFGGTSP